MIVVPQLLYECACRLLFRQILQKAECQGILLFDPFFRFLPIEVFKPTIRICNFYAMILVDDGTARRLGIAPRFLRFRRFTPQSPKRCENGGGTAEW